MTKICTKCGRELPLENFAVDRRARDGRCARCKFCQKEFRDSNKKLLSDRARKHRENNKESIRKDKKIYYEENKETILPGRHKYYLENREEILLRTKEFSAENPEHILRMGAKSRAKRYGLPFSLVESDIIIPSHCPVLGFILERREERTESSPSLDRIVPELGYVVGNIAVISDRANRLKNDGTSLEHRLIADWMIENLKFGIRIPPSAREITKDEKDLVYHARTRANRMGIEANIDFSDVMIPAVCPILGISLSKGPGHLHDWSPTLDRIDPTKGYIKGNVAVISHKANRIKNNGTAEEHLKIANWMDSMLQSEQLESNYEEVPNGVE